MLSRRRRRNRKRRLVAHFYSVDFSHKIGLFLSCKTSQFFFSSLYTPPLSLFDQMSRRKNKHPKRAVNVKTVVVASAAEEREEEEEEEEEPPVLCLKIPDEDEVVFEIEQKEIRKEKTTTTRGKRKRGHECGVCEKRFTRSGSLKTHMRIHTNEKPYECDMCEKRFTQSGSLKRHVRIHTKERPYKCDVCDKAFFESENLKVHMRIHTNEKPFECHVCEKRYRHATSLKYHMRTQH